MGVLFERFAILLDQHQARGEVPGHVFAGAPARPGEIAELERRLGHSLPADYRSFLERWNGARIYTLPRADTPCLFGIPGLLPQPPLLDDPRVLTVGMLDDEAYLVLDRRAPHAPTWPVHWADELDTPNKLLARPPIAAGLDEFLDRFIAAAGAWYWQAPKPLAWYKDPETPGLWRHGLGLSFALYQPYFHLALPQLPHAMTVPSAMMALGLRDHLLSLGVTFGPPPELNWETSHPSWLFGFDQANQPTFRLSEIPPAAPPEVLPR